MNCPACKKPLREKNVSGMTLDVCHGGCGGIWFDATELQRVDARAAATLHSVRQYGAPKPVLTEPRICPRCPPQFLDRRWFSDAKTVEIDQCGKCGGIWLDDGEFTRISEELKVPRLSPPGWAVAIAQAATAIQANPS
jgi:hypothetical protein